MRNLLAFMAMLPCIVAAQLPDYVPTSGLAAWFDFTQGIEDLSPNQVTIQLNGGAEYTGVSIVTNGSSSWAETDNLTTNFQGDPEFTVIIIAKRTNDFTYGSPWGLGGGIDVNGLQRTNINSWCNNFTNGIQLDLWGSHTLTTGQTYSSENFQVVVWRKSGIGFSSQSVSISINGSSNIALSQQRGSGAGYSILPDTSRFFLGKAGLENNYYAPMEFKAAGLFDRPLTDEEVNLLTSNLLIEGCTDSNACNFNEDAILDDGSCVSCDVLAQACGEGTVWDSVSSTCVPAILGGNIAEDCTVMNLQELAQNHLLLVDQLATADSLLAANLSPLESCGSGPWSCGDPITFWNYNYPTTDIGEQCWFSENLRTTQYLDGTSIPEVTDGTAWRGLSTGGRCVLDNNAANVTTYGFLYNWHAVNQSSGLCPTGWQVPSDEEWTSLEDHLTSQGFAGTEGTALKAVSGWNNNANGTDDFGFSGLPGGYRNTNIGADFGNEGSLGWWWSSTPDGNNAWYRDLSSSSALDRTLGNPRYGFSVRCIKG